MNAISKNPTAGALERLHRVAEASDRQLKETVMAGLAAANRSMEDALHGIMAEEHRDYRKVYRGFAGNFLSVSPAYGRFLYMMARTSGAKRIVEFGSSMGVSTIYLASALRDNGGGLLIGSEIETSKVVRSQFHLGAAGLGDLVEIRAGDALDTLIDVGGPVDLLLLDGALSLYLPVLKLAEQWLRPGALVLAEKAFCPDFLAYVGNPANGYLSLPLPIDRERGNVFSIWNGAIGERDIDREPCSA